MTPDAHTPHTWHAAAHVTVGTRRVPLEPDRIHVIGSGERADIRIVHDSVAAAHATVCAHDGRLIVEDIGSTEGTWVGTERIEGERTLPSGTAIRIGTIPIAIALGDPPPTAAAASVRTHPSFGELMAEELRRAPWFALSAVLHALLFLILYAVIPAPKPIESGVVRIEVAQSDPRSDDLVDIEAPEEPFEIEEPPAPEVPLPENPLEDLELDPPGDFEPADLPPSPLDEIVGPGTTLFAHVVGRSDGRGDLLGGGGDSLSPGFKRTIAGLRKSGLEIVFALDSTGSMGPVLDATKRRMVRMLEALHALVPDARIGIVTYRDDGPGEAYLTRSIPLDRDLYRALNFMQTVEAGGGGDRPEAVFHALEASIQQPWKPGAQRVVVVVGDAPAQPRTEDALNRLISGFVDDGRSHVHAIMTSTDLFGSISGDTKRSFERIARNGKGLCVSNEREDKILEEVLSLAIGAEHRKSIDEVFRILEQRETRASAHARDAVLRADANGIAFELRKPTVNDAFVRLLETSQSHQVADVLIRLLGSDDLPDSGRHAAAHALQHLLSLPRPPIDPIDPRPLTSREIRDLRTAAASRLR